MKLEIRGFGSSLREHMEFRHNPCHNGTCWEHFLGQRDVFLMVTGVAYKGPKMLGLSLVTRHREGSGVLLLAPSLSAKVISWVGWSVAGAGGPAAWPSTRWTPPPGTGEHVGC